MSDGAARRTSGSLIECVNEDHMAVEILSRRGKAVLMTADGYAVWQDATALFRSPTNARGLLDSYQRVTAGKQEEHDLERC